MNTQWMIYGANGYTGELIAREAVRRGLEPVLAGRRRDRIDPLARELGLDVRCFGLDDVGQASRQIEDLALVLNCAGPFSATAAPMMKACLQAGAHYLDITGEIAVFELAHSLDAQAREAGIVICPGVGFDVIPTDCIAAALKQQMPDATHLALGFDSRTGLSPGTAKTGTESLGEGGKVRRDGKIVSVPLAHDVRHIDFGDGNGERMAMTIPWGDVSTAYYTTGIPNIEVFIPASPAMIFSARTSMYMSPFLVLPLVRELMKAYVEWTVKGPGETVRSRSPAYVWGEVRNARGQTKTARIRTDNTYSLTVTGALAVVEHVMKNEPAGGAYTPASLVGADLVTRLPGSGELQIT
ncbi:MAG: saccharopine dehydrogenase NADP-binding domain-containing protein [Burkholderiaceae bacterium]